ncbi:hypothetical protein I6F07_07740 [Ensifer sp. IC4062]|nr:hypothetical protein [Ensifer sp. IC4062]MCA1440117.1 hypothetical protein [Ensifer sp. IC4062]
MFPSSRLPSDDLVVIADAAGDGIGLAWLPHWLIRGHLRAGDLTEL